jgi:hypothetical protein
MNYLYLSMTFSAFRQSWPFYKLTHKSSIIFLLVVFPFIPLSVLATFKPINLFHHPTVKGDNISLLIPETLVDTDKLKNVFNAATNNTYLLSPQYFGSYTIQPIGNDLFIGLSADLPASGDGALLSKYSNGNLTAILNSNGTNPIYEQGMHTMFYDGNTIYIPGTDPMDDWTLGNLYTYIPNQEIIKHRTIENGLHGLGILVEGNTIYMGTGSHTGDNITWEGRLYKSTDGGENWTYSVFSNYRLWNLSRFSGDLYGLGIEIDAGGWQNPIFRKSQDNGQTWETISGPSIIPGPYYRTNPTLFAGSLITKELGQIAVSGNTMVLVNQRQQFYPAGFLPLMIMPLTP